MGDFLYCYGMMLVTEGQVYLVLFAVTFTSIHTILSLDMVLLAKDCITVFGEVQYPIDSYVPVQQR